MIKFLEFLGLIANLHELQDYEEAKLSLTRRERELASVLLARYAFMLNSQVDEMESREIIKEFLDDEDLTVHNIHHLSILVKSTIFDKERNTIH